MADHDIFDRSETSSDANAFDSMFVALLLLTFVACILSGSTLQWVIARGIFTKGFFEKNNRYNIIVFVAASSSMLMAMSNFLSYYYSHDQIGYSLYLFVVWITMTHSSILLVSQKLSITYINSKQVWRRLLLINAAMAPVSILAGLIWGLSKETELEILRTMSVIIEPIQIALWGLIEFVLSGIFIVKMWKFKWNTVERQGIFVLVLVGFCDMATVFANLVIGDRHSTVVKAFAYCLRIRLEVGVLCSMADFLKGKHGSVYYDDTSKSIHSRPKSGFSSWMIRSETVAKESNIDPESERSRQAHPQDSAEDEKKTVASTSELVCDIEASPIHAEMVSDVEKSYTRKVTIDFTGSTAELGEDEDTCHV